MEAYGLTVLERAVGQPSWLLREVGCFSTVSAVGKLPILHGSKLGTSGCCTGHFLRATGFARRVQDVADVAYGEVQGVCDLSVGHALVLFEGQHQLAAFLDAGVVLGAWLCLDSLHGAG